MADTVLFLHGMGKHDSDWLDSHTRLLSEHLEAKFVAISYSDVVERASLTTLAEKPQEMTEIQEERNIAYATGFLAGKFGVDESPDQLQPMGDVPLSPTAFMDTWKYAIRYLLRRKVQRSVFTTVYEQVVNHLQNSKDKDQSPILLCHSLGTVIGLDLVHHPQIRNHVGRLITVGSPLGTIAAISFIGSKALPSVRRRVQVPWIDIATPDDIVAIGRISQNAGFNGRPLEVLKLQPGYPDPHSAYFFNESCVKEWVNKLMRSS